MSLIKNQETVKKMEVNETEYETRKKRTDAETIDWTEESQSKIELSYQLSQQNPVYLIPKLTVCGIIRLESIKFSLS